MELLIDNYDLVTPMTCDKAKAKSQLLFWAQAIDSPPDTCDYPIRFQYPND